MATADGVRGSGVGGILVDAGCARCADRGGRLVWARARDAALVFYARHEFEVVGDGFVDATTGLPAPPRPARRRLTRRLPRRRPRCRQCG